jgi:hypothetical protein
MSSMENKLTYTIEEVDITDEDNDDNPLINSNAKEKEPTLASTKNIQSSNQKQFN